MLLLLLLLLVVLFLLSHFLLPLQLRALMLVLLLLVLAVQCGRATFGSGIDQINLKLYRPTNYNNRQFTFHTIHVQIPLYVRVPIESRRRLP
jgi:hypothetical protein